MRFCFVKRMNLLSLLAGAGWLGLAATPANAQIFHRGGQSCPPPPVCPAPAPAYPTTPPTVPPSAPPAEPAAPPAPTVDLSTVAPESLFGGAGETAAFAPNMLGDLLLGSRSVAFSYQSPGGAFLVVGAGGTSITNPKVAENESPLPMDRFFFRYNFFNNAQSVSGISSGLSPQLFTGPQALPQAAAALAQGRNVSIILGAGGTLGLALTQPSFAISRSYDANEYTFGFEKTFLNQRASIEFRVPFQTSLASHLNLSAGNALGNVPGLSDPFIERPILNIQQTTGNTFGREDTEWGDMTLIFKGLAYQGDCVFVSGGLALGIPTGQDEVVHVRDFVGTFLPINQPTRPPQFIQLPQSIERDRTFHIDNEAWSLSPFLGLLVTPTNRLFVQGFMQWDFPVSDSNVTYTESIPGPIPQVTTLGAQQFNALRQVLNLPAFTEAQRQALNAQLTQISNLTQRTKVREQILMHADVGAGYWLLRDPQRPWITGIAPTLELHYTTTLENADIKVAQSDPFLGFGPAPVVGNLRNRVDILDMTVGTTFEIANRTTLATGFTFPLSQHDNRTFDWEFQLQLNYYFGASGTRRTPNVLQ